MVKSNNNNNRKNGNNKNNHNNNNNRHLREYKRLISMGRSSVDIINELYNPIDAINRFLNLALQHIDEDSQSRQFLLDSKSGVRKMSNLLNRLNNYAKKMEKEMVRITNNSL
jgi:hypothetical protein